MMREKESSSSPKRKNTSLVHRIFYIIHPKRGPEENVLYN